MDKKRLDYYKKKLQVRREELMKTIARTQEEGRTADEDPTVDLADKAANSYTKEFLFGMTNTDRTILNMIDAALKRINTDEYGVCANCQEEMQQKRLEAVPWAKHCITCQEKMEQGLLSLPLDKAGRAASLPRLAGRILRSDCSEITLAYILSFNIRMERVDFSLRHGRRFFVNVASDFTQGCARMAGGGRGCGCQPAFSGGMPDLRFFAGACHPGAHLRGVLGLLCGDP